MSLVLLQPTDNLIHTTMSPDSGVLVASFNYGLNTYTLNYIYIVQLDYLILNL